MYFKKKTRYLKETGRKGVVFNRTLTSTGELTVIKIQALPPWKEQKTDVLIESGGRGVGKNVQLS